MTEVKNQVSYCVLCMMYNLCVCVCLCAVRLRKSVGELLGRITSQVCVCVCMCVRVYVCVCL